MCDRLKALLAALFSDPFLQMSEFTLLRQLVFAIGAIALGHWSGGANRLWAADSSEPLPNIVLVMADDMGMGDTSAYQDVTGNADAQQLHTPQMERLARTGVRFTDAHTPSSRCTATRYGLLTGRYAWRNRLKHWVLFGAQGDPMIEADRPTFASLLRDSGYRTAMVGKWHVGLRYRRSDGGAAAGWQDADLTQPLFDCPVDHGFDFAWYTSRSHGTSGPHAGRRRPKLETRNQVPPPQVNERGPGHLEGRIAVGATGRNKQLVDDGPDAYVLEDLGSRHADHAISFLQQHVGDQQHGQSPFFLYYACNANHGPYTPDEAIADVPVAGAARTKSGQAMQPRYDFIYENDVALGRLLDWLSENEDPRRPGEMLIENTLVIFTSDNGAEIRDKTATGPFRSHKGSVFEGGHRVPFIASWPAGGVGGGSDATHGWSNESTICLTDMFATFAEISGQEMPDLRAGKKGGEDSQSILSALQGERQRRSYPLFFNDHNEASQDKAVVALRCNAPTVNGQRYQGQWKSFFEASLIRLGTATPMALYELTSDPREQQDLLAKPELQPLVQHLKAMAENHRNLGGHRYTDLQVEGAFQLDFSATGELSELLAGESSVTVELSDLDPATQLLDGVKVTMSAERDKAEVASAKERATFEAGMAGLGIVGGDAGRIDRGEAVSLSFNRDVVLESASLTAQNGACGGFYQIAENAPLAIYCIDADNDSKDQHGILSDLGVLPAGKRVLLNSSPHFGVEPVGSWQLLRVNGRVLAKSNSNSSPQ